MLKLDDPLLWGNEAAEDEDPQVLSSYFTAQSDFDAFFDPALRLRIARARKGMGKSALLRECEQRAREDRNAVVVSLRGADLVAQRPIEYLTPDEHLHDWEQRICMCINRHLGAEIGLALSDDKLTLVETAELAGYKQRNLISSLVARLNGNLGALQIRPLEASNHPQLLKRIVDEGDWTVWVFVDDIDATFINTREERLRLSTFFSACRDLASAFKGVNVRTCIRTDVWTSIRNVDEALDKVDQYIFDIHWSNRQLGHMLCDRIRSYQLRCGFEEAAQPADDVHPKAAEFLPLRNAFAAKFPWGRTRAPAYRVLHAYASGRPRWAMQLCRMAGERAARANDYLIKFGHIKQCLEPFGRKRLDDLAREHQHQCPQVLDIANAFSRQRGNHASSQLIAFVENTVRQNMPVEIDGRPAMDALEIVRFLFRIGFIVARDEQRRAVTYYRFEDKPELLKNHANLDDGMTWSVQSCFQTALGLDA